MTGKRRTWLSLLGVFLAMAVVALVVGHRLVDTKPSASGQTGSRTMPDSPFSGVHIDVVAPLKTQAASVEPSDESTTQSPIEEDRYLGKRQPVPQGPAKPPPLPPRDQTDPSPRAADDPADFELPDPSKR